MGDFLEKYTTIFLADSENPSRLLLLKRAESKKFAPHLWTGLGGGFEQGESALECAKRELKEETGLDNIDLVEFGRIVVNDTKAIYQFFGMYNGDAPECNEGVLYWVNVDEVFNREIIPTAEIFLREWKKRKWSIEILFTIDLQRENLDDVYSKVLKLNVAEALV